MRLRADPLRTCAHPSQGYALTVRHVLHLRGSARLLDSDPTLQRSINWRNPYVTEHLMQVDLLRRWRATAAQDQDCRGNCGHHQRHRARTAGDRLASGR